MPTLLNVTKGLDGEGRGKEVWLVKVYQRAGCVLGIGVLLISVNISSLSFAVDGQSLGPILGGLKSLYLQVEPVDPETEQKGIAAARLRRDTERQLKKAGIKLLSEGDFNKYRLSGSYPFARVDVSVTIDEVAVADSTLNVNFIVLKVHQQALLGRKPAIRFYAITWQRQDISYSNDVAQVHQTLRGIVDEFIAAYVSANPK